MKELLDGGSHDGVFLKIYGIRFEESIEQFRQSVMRASADPA
jgi:hypothetical protein